MAAQNNQDFDQNDKNSFFFRPQDFKKMTSVELEKSYKLLKKDYQKVTSVSAPTTPTRKRPLSPNEKTEESKDNNWEHPRRTAKRRTNVTTSTDNNNIIGNNNKFAPLNKYNMETDDVDDDAAEIQSKENKKVRPPPLHVTSVKIQEVIKILNEKLIEKTKYVIKVRDSENLTIFSNEIDIYDVIKNILVEAKLRFYTYTPKNCKPKNIILKGVKGDFNETQILKELNEKEFSNIEIKKVTKIIFNKKKPDLYHFLIQLSPNSDTAELYKIKYLAHQKIWWETLRKKKIFQCKNCQRIGHTSANCHLGYRCVKCSKSHKYGECEIKELAEKQKIYCVNCDEYGHPASYKGCPFIKEVQKANDLNRLNLLEKHNKKINKIHNYTRDNTSYAQATTNNNLDHSIFLNQNSNIKSTSTSQNQNLNNNNLSFMIDNMKKELISVFCTKIQEITNVVMENSSRIDYLYTLLEVS